MRRWHEGVANLADGLPGGAPALGVLLLILTAVVAGLWYWWPEWWRAGARTLRRLARSLGRLVRALAQRWRARPEETPAPMPVELPEPDPEPEPAADHLPAVAAGVLLVSADELAAQGRFAEAVRERLRAIVRELVDRGVVHHHPGWTVTELAVAAGAARPELAAPLTVATDIFSAIWYGQRPATAAHDAQMRQHAAAVQDALARPRVPA